MRITWAPRALERLEEVLDWMADANPAAARRWVNRVFVHVARLRDFPDSGRMVPEARRPEVGEVLVGKYRVIYRRDPKRVVILTIRHVRQSAVPDEEVTP